MALIRVAWSVQPQWLQYQLEEQESIQKVNITRCQPHQQEEVQVAITTIRVIILMDNEEVVAD